MLDIPFVNTQIYGTQFIKYNCMGTVSNFRNNFAHIYTFAQMHLYTSKKTSVKDYLTGKY